ncbi:hypothetical protein [Flavihumibacter petaseus]|uniref:Lipoprotein n=1 Tax=Flavihumibacter petaseus NBRC 106054 TaxID=1220578 RepID=A0A0E9MVB3_9BACT|nr:hypothetical protein [Flavihumibacter petaseus]GAO41418.1 hypothetical protein FPE01S_01_04300 [Flavihumibacter petaseus NBRC 106054]
MKAISISLSATLRTLVLALLTISLMTACSKSKDEKKGGGFEGVYEGKWGEEFDEPAYHYKLRFKSGGTLERLDESDVVIASGQWSRNGIDVEGYYIFLDDGSKFSFAGLYTDFDGAILGNWGFDNSKANGGTFEIKKK